MKLKKLFKAVKIGAAVAKTLATGTVAKTLRDVGVYIDLTENVVEQIKKAKDDVKKKD